MWQARPVPGIVAACLLALAAPVSGAANAASAPAPTKVDPAPASAHARPAAAPTEDDEALDTDAARYSATHAARDVGIILHDTSLDYVRARARLVEHPALATEALTDRLLGVPPPAPAQHKRILDILAALGGTEHLPRFADELRRTALRTDQEEGADPLAAVEPWRQLLLQAGAAARPTLLELVGDNELPRSVRGALLEDVVTVSQGTDLIALVGLAGGSDRFLQQTLRRALRLRATADPTQHDALLAATDRALNGASADDLPALINLRVSLQRNPDPRFARAMAEILQQPDVPFTSEISVVRALASRPHPEGLNVLVPLAHEHLAPDRRGTQRSELLGWVALEAVPAPAAQRIIAAHDLLNADAPRLAATAYLRAELDADFSWLAAGMANPWPQVRQAALQRVAGPCPDVVLQRLATAAGRTEDGGDDNAAVARSAARALARCGGPKAFSHLRDLLRNQQADLHRRGTAARLLVEAFESRGVEAVAQVLAATPPQGVARALVRSLRLADPADPSARRAARRALCAATLQGPLVARQAREALHAMAPDESVPCPSR